MDWQPIETAPKDGTWFVIWTKHGIPEVGRYETLYAPSYEHVEGDIYRLVKCKIYDWCGFNNFHAATHWLPLSEPPK